MLRRYSRSKPVQAGELHSPADALAFLQSSLDQGKDLDKTLKDVLAGLQTLAKAPGAEKGVVYDQFVDATLETSQEGTVRAIPLILSLAERSEDAWGALETISSQGSFDTKRKVFTESGMVAAMVASLQRGGEYAHAVLKLLSVLIQQSANKKALVRITELTGAFVDTLSSKANAANVKNECMKIIADAAFNLSSHEPQLALFEVPRLVEVIGQLVEGQTAVTAMRTLHNLCLPPQCAVYLSQDNELMDNLVNTQLRRNTRGAVILLHLLSNQAETHASLFSVGIVPRLNELKPPADDGYVEMRRTMMLANLVGGNKNTWSQLNSVNEASLVRILDLLRSVVESNGQNWPLHVPLRALYSLTLVDEHRMTVLKDAPGIVFQALKQAYDKKDFQAVSLAASTLSNYTCELLRMVSDQSSALTRFCAIKQTVNRSVMHSCLCPA